VIIASLTSRASLRGTGIARPKFRDTFGQRHQYAWIEAQQAAGTFRVEMMCELLGVVRSAYYAWTHCPQSARAGEDERLMLLIDNAFEQSRKTYGVRPIQYDLKALGESVSTRRIGKLMKNAGLHCKTRRKFKATTNSKHTEPIADNVLNRQLSGRYNLYCHR